MLEVWTKRIPADTIRTALGRAQALPGFRGATAAMGPIRTRAAELPSLAGHQVQPIPGVKLIYPAELHAPADVEAACARLLPALAGDVKSLVCRVSVSDTTDGYDAAETSDLVVQYGRTFAGHVVRLDVGAESVAAEDFAARATLFERFAELVGGAPFVDVGQAGGGVQVAAKDLPSLGGLERSELPLSGTGILAFETGDADAAGNPRFLSFVVGSAQEALDHGPAAVRALASRGVAAAEIWIGCAPPRYEDLRAKVAAAEVQGWDVQTVGKARFEIDGLPQAMDEHQAFFCQAFTFEEPATGEVAAELHYEQGTARLALVCDYRDDAQEQRLHEIVTELVGDAGLLDLRPT
ncbi:MAG: hypothetical protein AAF682_13155 [Planctomycetota bacterium]